MKEKTIYALGVFDGVHVGHQALLRACKELAQENHCKAGIVTFDTHPDGLVSEKAPALLNTIEDRTNLLMAYGMDVVVQLPFNRELMSTHWSDFLRSLAGDGGAGFVCGSDFRFGSGGLGTAKKLEAFCKKQGLPYAIVPQQLLDGQRISSTHIRSLIAEGDLENATRFLGHPHVFTGQVIPGRGLGRTIGVPTANLQIPPDVLLPKEGVYACAAHVNGKNYPAVTNIGSRPTVDGHQVRAESWILDFAGDLYGRTIALEFHKFLRPEQKFASLEELKAQIQQDAAQTAQLLR